MLRLLHKFLNLSDINFVSASDSILLGSPISEKNNNLILLYWVICAEPLYLFDHIQFAVVIYNAKIMLVISGKDGSSNR